MLGGADNSPDSPASPPGVLAIFFFTPVKSARWASSQHHRGEGRALVMAAAVFVGLGTALLYFIFRSVGRGGIG